MDGSGSRAPVEIAAFYFPQFHHDRRNAAWHGPGWTEWELLRAARPRFAGHRQPIQPDWGEFDQADPVWAAREIDLAADHGLTCFVYDWYWYADEPFLQGALEQGFLRAPNRARLKFGLLWANHDWRDYFPAPAEGAARLLLPGIVSASGFERLAAYVLERYASEPNYLLVAGEPYFSIYDLATFVKGLGGLGPAGRAVAAFRRLARRAGFAGLHLNVMDVGLMLLDDDPVETIRELGVSSVSTYSWAHHFDLSGGTGFPAAPYAEAAARNVAAWQASRRRWPVPYHPNVSVGWDPSPRTVQSAPYRPRGYPWTAILVGNTPARFEAALQRARAFLEEPETPQQLLMLNAWNEWTEGSYLLPDAINGGGYLEALRRVFPPDATCPRPGDRLSPRV